MNQSSSPSENTKKDIWSAMDKVFIGMSVIGKVSHAIISGACTTEAATVSGPILAGLYDVELYCALYWKEFGNAPMPHQMDDEKVRGDLASVKNYVRWMVQQVIIEANAIEKAESQSAHKLLIEDLARSSKPHPMGTVDEIAAKYGVSKSEVRRRKAQGTLYELMKEKS